MRLITSAAYVGQELSAEFGEIPPAFLPVGVARLYEAQIARLGPGRPIFLTIPETFTPQPHDQRRLVELGVVLLPVPAGLRLGESVVYAMNSIDMPPGAVEILHGDTLIDDLPAAAPGDVIAIHDEGDDYSWAAVDVEADQVTGLEVLAAGSGRDDPRSVACGYFGFSNSSALVRAITRARGDFIGGINLYARERPMRAAPARQWHDFGHIQTYFRSRRAITTARSFNTLHIDATTVRKSSRDTAKMRAEAHWLTALPAPLLPFSARLLQNGEADDIAFYATEYQYAPTLSELFVFSSVGRATWKNILSSCHDFLEACAGAKGGGSGDAVLSELAVDKTMARLERYNSETGFDIDAPTRLDGRPLPSLRRIAAELTDAIDLGSGRAETVMHGDFCFSNILYNSRAARISVIDPRGYVRVGTNSLFGDTRYDLAKLSHSIAGHYDHIVAGRYALARDGSHGFSITFETSPHHHWLQGALGEFVVDGVAAGGDAVRAITVGLFLSMLPLHDDRPDRQVAFIANTLRLYAELQGHPS